MSSDENGGLRRELEAKNRELAMAVEKLASTQERYSTLYNLTPVGHLTIDSNGFIRQANDTALEVFGAGRDALLRQPMHEFVAAGDREAYDRFQQAMFAEDAVQIGEFRFRRPDGTALFAELRGRRLTTGNTARVWGLIVVANVSERREMHDALRRRNRELAALNQFARAVSDSFEVGEVVANLEEMLRESADIGAGVIYTYEIGSNELHAASEWGAPSSAGLPSPLILAAAPPDEAMSGHSPLYIRDTRQLPPLLAPHSGRLPENAPSVFVLMAARGQIEGAIWLFGLPGQVISEERIAYFGTLAQQAGVALRSARLFEDVRHGKERLRLLTREIVSVQEKERKRVSRELHDEAGQLLTALKLSLEILAEDLQQAQEGDMAQADVHRRLSSAITLSERVMAHIRRLVHNLRPTALDDLGLNSALEGLCHDFAQRGDTDVHYHYEVDEALALPDSVQLVAYRFLQEALTNVSKHADATQVEVAVWQSGGNMRLLVHDDGVGFDTGPATEGLGILGMRERLESVGGRLEIVSEPHQGTRLSALIPIDS